MSEAYRLDYLSSIDLPVVSIADLLFSIGRGLHRAALPVARAVLGVVRNNSE